jgi:hypothetical protein
MFFFFLFYLLVSIMQLGRVITNYLCLDGRMLWLHTLGSGGPSLYTLRQAFVGPFPDAPVFLRRLAWRRIDEFFPAYL